MVEQIIIRPAEQKDIAEILKIQENLLLKNKTIKSALKEGFLVYALKEDELKEIINSGKDFLIVATENGLVIGYALAHDLNEWRKNKSKWDKRIIVSPKTRDHIYSDKIIYFRHIARKPDYVGVGKMLEEQIYSLAKNKGFKYVIAEILEQPISNDKSREIHEERGYLKIGQANYLDGNFWGLYERIL
jgi:L-amino acid N-acyltransferase YncA